MNASKQVLQQQESGHPPVKLKPAQAHNASGRHHCKRTAADADRSVANVGCPCAPPCIEPPAAAAATAAAAVFEFCAKKRELAPKATDGPDPAVTHTK